MNRCIIVGAGEFFPACAPSPKSGDLVIAADGGYTYLRELSINIDLLVADFDSLTQKAPQDIPTMQFKPEKDDTDTGIAIAEGIRRGFTRFDIYGGTGGRADHTFANYQALIHLARNGMQGFLYGNGWAATAVCNSSLDLRPLQSGTVSVFSADSQCHGVSIEGLKYTLDRVTLTNDYPLGVSNELLGNPARISVENGTLLIFCPIEALYD